MRPQSKLSGRTAHRPDLRSDNTVIHLFSIRTSCFTPQICANRQLTDYGSTHSMLKAVRNLLEQRCPIADSAARLLELQQPVVSCHTPKRLSQQPKTCTLTLAGSGIHLKFKLLPGLCSQAPASRSRPRFWETQIAKKALNLRLPIATHHCNPLKQSRLKRHELQFGTPEKPASPRGHVSNLRRACPFAGSPPP